MKLLLRQPRWPLILVLPSYIALAMWMAWHVPLFEAPDSYYHFAVIQHYRVTGEAPPKTDPGTAPWQQMTYHAPLYYRISALLIKPFDVGDFSGEYPRNPHAAVGEPGAQDNRNFVAHAGDPWQRSGAAARVLRAFSILLGGLSLFGVYAIAGQIAPGRRDIALLAMAIVAFNPQFLFMSSEITNDALLTTLSTLALALCLHQMRSGVKPVPMLALSLILAAGALTKTSGMVLYPVIALGILYACWREKLGLRRIAFYAGLGLFTWLIIAGGWYWQNWQLFGDPGATTQIAQATGPRVGGIIDLTGEMRGLFFSFWGLFGWFNILSPESFYAWVIGLIAIAALGMAWALARRAAKPDPLQRIMILLLLGHAALHIGSWWQFHQLVNAAQGRLWFPLLAGISVALAWGLAQWPRWLSGGLLAGLLAWAIWLPAGQIAPVYAPSATQDLATWQAPQAAQRFSFREPWREDACLDLWLEPITWDGQSPITLNYAWAARCPMTGYWSVFLHFIDTEQERCVAGDTAYILVQTDSMPDGGRIPTAAMLPGRLLQDSLTLAAPQSLPHAGPWHIQTGLYDAGGSFIRAFVTQDGDATDALQIGRCAPESIQLQLQTP